MRLMRSTSLTMSNDRNMVLKGRTGKKKKKKWLETRCFRKECEWDWWERI